MCGCDDVAKMTRGRVVTVISIVRGAVCGEEGTISIRGSQKIQAPFLDVTVSRCPALTVGYLMYRDSGCVGPVNV